MELDEAVEVNQRRALEEPQPGTSRGLGESPRMTSMTTEERRKKNYQQQLEMLSYYESRQQQAIQLELDAALARELAHTSEENEPGQQQTSIDLALDADMAHDLAANLEDELPQETHPPSPPPQPLVDPISQTQAAILEFYRFQLHQNRTRNIILPMQPEPAPVTGAQAPLMNRVLPMPPPRTPTTSAPVLQPRPIPPRARTTTPAQQPQPIPRSQGPAIPVRCLVRRQQPTLIPRMLNPRPQRPLSTPVAVRGPTPPRRSCPVHLGGPNPPHIPQFLLNAGIRQANPQPQGPSEENVETIELE